MTVSVMFRVHLIHHYPLGHFPRFIRWDRRGCIVTHRFNYPRNLRLLSPFHGTIYVCPTSDPSVTAISDDDPHAPGSCASSRFMTERIATRGPNAKTWDQFQRRSSKWRSPSKEKRASLSSQQHSVD
ncbi:hypothetical protein BDZ89DRAFT_376940 [Hymenopellis radicata]|nr:hypothetical protein BDZ89DRAFT_376940 [Hymenopellis radicata]